ncbi:MAG: PqqD family protein [Actinomycetia bacterium]|nr:PqqD family protein [Actinomycetes bacterium]
MTQNPMHLRPMRRSGLTLRSTNAGFEVIDESGETVAALNDTGLALWRVCDGEATIEEIVRAAAQLFDAPVSVIEADISRAVEQFHAQGLLEVEPGAESS